MNANRRSLFCIALLTLLSSSAAAEWLPVESNHDLDVFVDPDTRIKQGDTVRIMALFNYKKPGYAHGKLYRSSLMQDEYDCAGEKRRRLYLSAHSEPMAQGKTVLRNPSAGDWKPVAPASIGERLWKSACEEPRIRNDQADSQFQ
jgi:hypothetical protein